MTVYPNPIDLPAIRAWSAQNRPDLPAVRTWAAPLLRTAEQTGPTPALGTSAWLALPDEDPRKLGAALRTALIHLAENTAAATAGRLRAELDDFATAVRRMFAEANREASAYARERRLTGYEIGPTHAELVRRRACLVCPACRTTVPYGDTRCLDCGWQPSAPRHTGSPDLTWTEEAA